MASPNWKDIAEIVAVVAIVASLLFVGLQLKQGQDIALANQFQARTQAMQGLIQTQMEIGEVTDAPGFRDAISKGISAADINEAYWLWIAFDNHYFQYQSGFLEESAMAGPAEKYPRIVFSMPTKTGLPIGGRMV